MNITQKRILENNKPKVDTRPRSTFLCLSWSAENQSGEIADLTGFRFGVTVDDLAPECEGQARQRVDYRHDDCDGSGSGNLFRSRASK
jgi:hypothetical protein